MYLLSQKFFLSAREILEIHASPRRNKSLTQSGIGAWLIRMKTPLGALYALSCTRIRECDVLSLMKNFLVSAVSSNRSTKFGTVQIFIVMKEQTLN